MKKLSAFLLALVMFFGCMTAGTIEAAAEEITSTNPYTYSVQNWTFPDDKSPTNKGEGVHMWLGCAISPFYVKVRTTANGSSSNEVTLFDLYDEVNQHTVEAFCIDVDTKIDNAFYKRINLEDGSYFTLSNAQKIRAIVNNGVTVKSLAEIENAANIWLKANGKAEVVGLTGAEALSATQYAIWCMANEKDVVSTDPYANYYVPSYTFIQASAKAHLYGSPCTDPVTGLAEVYTTMYSKNPIKYNQTRQYNEDGINISEQNITGVAEYLLSLEPEAAKEIALSASTIENPGVTYKLEADGTYTAVVEFNLSATMTEGTTLTATISVGDKNVSKAVESAGPQTLTLKGLTEKADIKIEINGQQKVSDVFFFEAEGGRKASQTLVGIDSCMVPVHAETVVKTERVINISKTTMINEGGKEVYYPLEGITFDIYYVGTVDDYTDFVETVAETYRGPKENFAAAAQEKFEVSKTDEIRANNVAPVATVVTDITGKAVCNLPAEQEDGIFLVIERDHLAIVEPMDPFVVAVPMTAQDGSGLKYSVDVYPKNELVIPDIKKDVISIENNEASVNAGEEFTWIVRGDIPADIANAKKYEITDTLDEALTYAGDMAVKVEEVSAAADNSVSSGDAVYENVLLEKTDYTLVVSDQTWTVTLTKAGLAKVVGQVGEKTADYELRVYFNTIVDGDAEMGEKIPNQATLKYTNSANFKFEVESDIPEVYTCGISLEKYDAKDNRMKLNGAEFMLARLATEEEIADENVKTEKLVIAKGTPAEVVYVDFYTDANMSKDQVTTVTTDAEGKALIYGLEAGNYYLVETKAPAGYNLLSYPIKVTLDAESHASVVGVANSNTFELPSTGGIGTTIFTLVGAALTLGSGAVLAGKKRKEETEE